MMGSWLLLITCGSMVVSMLQVILPKSGTGNVGRLAGGLMLLLLTLQPLLDLDLEELIVLAESEWVQTEGFGEEELTGLHHDYLEMFIEKETAAYIQDKAESLGVSCVVSVSYEWETNEQPYLTEVIVTCADAENARNILEGVIEEEFGIEKQRQIYIGTVE